MDKPLRLKLKKRYHLTRPAHVVNVCFIVVLFFSTLLIWREINVLEEAYVANQRNNLANVAHEMDGLLQFNIDRMMFFRHGMQSALEQPLDIDVLRKASQRYLSQRHQEAWRVALRIAVRCRCLASRERRQEQPYAACRTIRWR
jgi:uncharacterized membrane protein YjdF